MCILSTAKFLSTNRRNTPHTWTWNDRTALRNVCINWCLLDRTEHFMYSFHSLRCDWQIIIYIFILCDRAIYEGDSFVPIWIHSNGMFEISPNSTFNPWHAVVGRNNKSGLGQSWRITSNWYSMRHFAWPSRLAIGQNVCMEIYRHLTCSRAASKTAIPANRWWRKYAYAKMSRFHFRFLFNYRRWGQCTVYDVSTDLCTSSRTTSKKVFFIWNLILVNYTIVYVFIWCRERRTRKHDSHMFALRLILFHIRWLLRTAFETHVARTRNQKEKKRTPEERHECVWHWLPFFAHLHST